MLKHVLGAKSSPRMADFCLKRTAELEKGGIAPEAVESVKRNMYRGDLMISTTSVQTAINLAKQLSELLSKGGFRLTKWCSDSRQSWKLSQRVNERNQSRT